MILTTINLLKVTGFKSGCFGRNLKTEFASVRPSRVTGYWHNSSQEFQTMKDMKKGLEDLGSCVLRMLDYQQSLVFIKDSKALERARKVRPARRHDARGEAVK